MEIAAFFAGIALGAAIAAIVLLIFGDKERREVNTRHTKGSED